MILILYDWTRKRKYFLYIFLAGKLDFGIFLLCPTSVNFYKDLQHYSFIV